MIVANDTGSVSTPRTPFRGMRARMPWGDAAMELLIRLCGYSAIFLVFGIFFFVFKEGAPILLRSSRQWYQWTAPADGELRVDVKFDHAHGDLDLYLLDGDANELDRSTSRNDDERGCEH